MKGILAKKIFKNSYEMGSETQQAPAEADAVRVNGGAVSMCWGCLLDRQKVARRSESEHWRQHTSAQAKGLGSVETVQGAVSAPTQWTGNICGKIERTTCLWFKRVPFWFHCDVHSDLVGSHPPSPNAVALHAVSS